MNVFCRENFSKLKVLYFAFSVSNLYSNNLVMSEAIKMIKIGKSDALNIKLEIGVFL